VGKRTRARECAFQMLYQWDIGKESMDLVTEAFWKVRSTTDETRAAAERLARGAQGHAEAIDAAIAGVTTNWKLERIASVDLNILRIGAYELMWEPKTPAAVVLDEAVEMAKRFGEEGSPAFVNGVLDAIRGRLDADRKAAGSVRSR
jgi:transcription antitermination protein NusB